MGFAGLKYLPELEEVDIGYRFASKFWGKGFATECGEALLKFGFEELNLKRIIAWVMPENTASINVLQKLGFQEEKRLIDDGDLVVQFFLNSNFPAI